jgi:hypothetical protein
VTDAEPIPICIHCGKAIRPKMVVTLRSGAQIASDVDEFTLGRSPIERKLNSLEWTGTGSGALLKYVDLSEVVAVHVEREPGDEPDEDEPQGADDPAASR